MSPPDSGVPPRSAQLGTKLTLHLGVAVIPYADRRSLTTGDVASFLESKYDLMATFYRVHEADVAKALEDSLGGALESALMGKSTDPWGRATQAIQREFRTFISSMEAERVGIPGTPTKAALMGTNHRLAHPYSRRNPRRPSFRDRGIFQSSFRAWIS